MVFVALSILSSSDGTRGLNQKEENSVVSEHSETKNELGKGFSFKVGTRSIRVSAEERSRLDGVYTVGKVIEVGRG